MKKSIFPSLVLSGLTALSLFCYINLQVAACNSNDLPLTSNEQLEETEQSTSILLPDVALVKRVLNITKIIMPKD